MSVRVLDLEPIPRRARPVGRGQPLRDDAFEAHAAVVPEDHRAVIVWFGRSGRCRAAARPAALPAASCGRPAVGRGGRLRRGRCASGSTAQLCIV
jgi:hypothetical protein